MSYSVSKTVSDETLNCIITIESAGKPNIKASTSSALGLGQFLNQTWLNVVRKHRPDVFQATDEAALLKMRTNPSFAIEMLARFTEDNQRIVGMACAGGDLYLAHFLGATAAQRVYAADPKASVEPLVGAAAVRANRSVLAGKTCAQVRAWAAKRMYDSRGHAWVSKYYVPAPEPASEPEEDIPAVEDNPDDFPDTQGLPATKEDTPAATVTRDDLHDTIDRLSKKEVESENWSEWAAKLAKSKIQWASTAMGSVSLASITGVFGDALKDPRVVIAMIVAVVALVAVIIVERGRKP